MEFSTKDQVFLLVLAFLFQLVSIVVIPLGYECDAAAYFRYDPALTYRPPLFPLLLTITGQYLFHTFWGTIVIHGVFGIITPILMYRILYPIGRCWSLVFSMLLIFTFIPFASAKIMLATQLE